MRAQCFVAAAAFLLGVATPFAFPRAGQPELVPICPAPELALLAAREGPGLPEDCHVVVVRRVDTRAGAVCELDFSRNLHGLPGAVATLMRVPMRWWVACGYLRL
ncbi:MAG: hypothetical protein IRY87_25680 [Acetobacteraceae bacterium]|nr:hypothetical protein [Acetobacteraceae bacterium]